MTSKAEHVQVIIFTPALSLKISKNNYHSTCQKRQDITIICVIKTWNNCVFFVAALSSFFPFTGVSVQISAH